MKIRRWLADGIYNQFPYLSALVAGLYGFAKAPTKSYSLYGEDLVLMELFHRDRSGVYVDVGAFHARWLSNTYLLDKLGWFGVAVDVEKEKLLTFRTRGRCFPRVGAVVPKGFGKEYITLYKFKRMSSEYDTIDKGTADDYALRYGMKYEECHVPAIPIDLLLEETSREYGRNIRYLNIDIEGADEGILLSIDPGKFGIEVVQFENNREFGGSPVLRQHMESCGYKLTATLGGTHTYALGSFILERFPGKIV
jgi:hypothetical protein